MIVPAATSVKPQPQSATIDFDRLFLTSTPASRQHYGETISATCDRLMTRIGTQTQPYSGLDFAALARQIDLIDPCPEVGISLDTLLTQVDELIIQHSVVVSDPHCIAHLHCPPLVPALAAEVLITAMNQSMDSWDQSPSATLLEQKLVNWLCQLFGFDCGADGTFTSGGTQSNFMGLLLARDRYARERLDWNIQERGLPPEASRFRILCSEVSHFTVMQSAALLGLGHQAVVKVATDDRYQMCPQALATVISELQAQDLLPMAIVATAGTTDFGSIDPLPQLADLARSEQIWLHVDAAFGGALILSDRHQHKLVGIDLADSITVDFHKLFYQPISCGAFLLREGRHFNLLRLHADYLNPASNAELGILDLVVNSIQTTKRFDALKLFMSLQALGRQTFAAAIDLTIDLATDIAIIIEADPHLILAAQPTINAVVFRYIPQYCPEQFDPIAQSNQINDRIRLALIHQGTAIIAQTKVGNLIQLKFTLLNPRTELSHLTELLDRIKQLGQTIEIDLATKYEPVN
jgi:L-2,4-diaminobutyrate decarboxylase